LFEIFIYPYVVQKGTMRGRKVRKRVLKTDLQEDSILLRQYEKFKKEKGLESDAETLRLILAEFFKEVKQ